MAAFRKRPNRGSNSSLSGRDGRGSNGGSGLGSSISLDDFYSGNRPERSGSTQSLRKAGIDSPGTIQRKQNQFEQRLADLITEMEEASIMDPLPIEKLGDNKEARKRKEILKEYRMKRFNSTSTLFIDSCLINSDILEFLK